MTNKKQKNQLASILLSVLVVMAENAEPDPISNSDVKCSSANGTKS
jgi:hypothetical protein